MRQFTNYQKLIKENVFFIIVISFLSTLLFVSPLLVSHRFILLSFLPVLCFSYLLFNNNEIIIWRNASDIFWLLFVFVGLLSFFWSTNRALIWFPLFSWLSLLLWMIIFRIFSIKGFAIHFVTIVCTIFILTSLYVFILIVTNRLNEIGDWNHYLGYNKNFISAYLISLFPFLMFYSFKTNFIKITKVIGAFFILYISYNAGARGALIIFSSFLLYYIQITYLRISFKNLNICVFVLTFFLITISYFFSTTFLVTSIIEDINLYDNLDRFYLFQSSIKTFLNNPVFGVGLGNWMIDAYAQGIDGITRKNHFVFYRLGSHNLYGQHLVELGLIGFIAYIYPILCSVKVYLYKKKLTKLELALYSSIIIYLVAAFFYRNASNYEGHFSPMQLLFFCSLGLLPNRGRGASLWKLNKYVNLLFLLLSLICFLWFIYFEYTRKIFIEVEKMSSNNPKTIDLLESIYEPNFKTTHGYYGGYTGSNKSIGLQIAELYKEQEDYNNAEIYFQKSLRIAPNDEYLLLSYAKFLLRVKNDLKKAKKHLTHIYKIQDNHVEVNMLLAEITLSEGTYNEFKKYINEKNNKIFKYYQYLFLEQQLYFSDYLDSLVQLTNNQRTILMGLRQNYDKEKLFYKANYHVLGSITSDFKSNTVKNRIKASNLNQQKELFHLLTKEQYLLYLKDRLASLYVEKQKNMCRMVSCTDRERKTIENLLLEIGVQREYLKLKSMFLGVPSSKKELDNLSILLDTNLFELLTEKQYIIYKKNRI